MATIVVEGNIGSGKTTFLKRFKNVSTLPEPVEKWREGYNLLDLFYKDPKRWAYTFQSKILLTLLENHDVSGPKIMERSVFSGMYCFAKYLLESGHLHPAEYSLLSDWFLRNPVDVKTFIYLRTTPEVAFNRIQKRGRPEEKNISMDYIKAIHALHDNWLLHSNLNVIVVDADLDIEDNIVNNIMQLLQQ
jgi:deoxynucleoside kinase